MFCLWRSRCSAQRRPPLTFISGVYFFFISHFQCHSILTCFRNWQGCWLRVLGSPCFPTNLSSPCTPIYWEIADYSDCRKSSLESTGIFTRCVFSKSQKSRHHGEGDCKRPLSLLTPLSPKECRVAWAYSIASHWVSFYCAVLSITDNLDHTDGYNTLTITSYLPYCSFFSSCVCVK